MRRFWKISVRSVEICYTLAVSRDTICSKYVSSLLSLFKPTRHAMNHSHWVTVYCAQRGVMCAGAKAFTCKRSSCLLRTVGWNRIQYYNEPTRSCTISFFPSEQVESKKWAQDSQSFRLSFRVWFYPLVYIYLFWSIKPNYRETNPSISFFSLRGTQGSL